MNYGYAFKRLSFHLVVLLLVALFAAASIEFLLYLDGRYEEALQAARTIERGAGRPLRFVPNAAVTLRDVHGATYTFTTNSYGTRGRGFSADGGAGRKIAVIGGGVVVGAWLPDDETLSAMIESEIGRVSIDRIEVLNLGFVAPSLSELADFVEARLKSIGPDLLVLAIGVKDDLPERFTTLDDMEKEDPVFPAWVYREMRIFHFLYEARALGNVRPLEAEYYLPDAPFAARRRYVRAAGAVRRIGAACRAAGVGLVTVVVPSRAQVEGSLYPGTTAPEKIVAEIVSVESPDFDFPSNRIAAACRQAGADAVVDLLTVFRRPHADDIFIGRGDRLSATAIGRAAEAIAGDVAASGLVPVKTGHKTLPGFFKRLLPTQSGRR